ncbi:hypothetical protein ACJX0J_039114, partial [Zea mays]
YVADFFPYIQLGIAKYKIFGAILFAHCARAILRDEYFLVLFAASRHNKWRKKRMVFILQPR